VRTKNPQLFAEEARIRSAEKNRELTYKNRYPDFTLGVSPIQYQGSVKEWELMVELNLPLQQGSRRAQERESEAMLSAAQARRDARQPGFGRTGREPVRLRCRPANRTLAATSLLPQSELTFKAALAGYETGKVDFATLLDAQRQIRQARQNRIKAQADAQMRLAEIERILGEDL
jgi:outer membrane protein TolC